jgi:peptidoglycan/xylan/chitin deacetylase (PgdA/CDA1 family)
MVNSIYRPSNIKRLGSEFLWKDDKKVAVIIDVAYECWTDNNYSGVGPMGNILKPGFIDTNAISWGRYGVVRGIHRLLDILRKHKVQASFMVNGVIAELYPEDVKKVFEAGHSIHAHSYGMDVIPVYLDEVQEKINIEKTTLAIQNACGYRPNGWISPRATRGPNSAKLLIDAGYKWHSDAMDDDLPYLEKYEHGNLMAIPFTMEINDMPHAIRYGNQPEEMVGTFIKTLDWMVKEDANSSLMNFTAHTHVYGRPAGAVIFDQLIEHTKLRQDIWVATRNEVFEYVSDYIHSKE